MNHYEILAIITGALADTEVPSAITKIEEALKKYECSIHYTQNLERRRLAYPIKRQQYGSYALIEFDCAPDMIKKIEHELGLTSELLRHTIVRRLSVGKPRPIFKDADGPLMSERRPVRREIKTKTLDEALQTVERETQSVKESSLPNQQPPQLLREETAETQKQPHTAAQPDAKVALSDEDLEKQLNDKLEEILKDEIY